MKRSVFWLMSVLVVFVAAVGVARAQVSPLEDRELVETLRAVPTLKAAAAYEVKDDTIVLELSEYAGYAGLIVANGGLEPSENSVFFRKHGFKVHITLSEEEAFSRLNSGEIAASATTADVLPIYGRQLQVDVPALIGFSRGATGIIVRKEIRRINDLRGKVLASAQFTEADFLIRYLAREAGLEIQMLDDLAATPDPQKVNLVYCADGFAAGDLFLRDLQAGRTRLAGCVTWAPKTTEVVEASGGRANLLVSNKNLLLVADVLMVNRGLARARPDIVRGLTDGLLQGNVMIRQNAAEHAPVIAKALDWTIDDVKSELESVHLANGPENLAFFDGTIDSAGSFGYITASAQLSYGKELADVNLNPDTLLSLKPLRDLDKAGGFKGQSVSLVPIRSEAPEGVEQEPILSKNVQFNFEPNSSNFDAKDQANAVVLQQISRTLQISPGSIILLRGHADNTNIPVFRKAGGEKLVQEMALKAIQLSKDRTAAITRVLIDQYNVEESRVQSVGRGWEEPLGDVPEKNRRVEVQWFTVE